MPWTVQSTFFTAAALTPPSLVAVKTDKDFFSSKELHNCDFCWACCVKKAPVLLFCGSEVGGE